LKTTTSRTCTARAWEETSLSSKIILFLFPKLHNIEENYMADNYMLFHPCKTMVDKVMTYDSARNNNWIILHTTATLK
jgi:hypothetical protein